MNAQEGTPNAPEKSGDSADEETLGAVVQQVFSGLAISRTGPSHHPIFDKFEPEHVSQFLSQAHEQEQDEHRLERFKRWFRLAYALVGVGVFVFLTLLLLPEHSSLYIEILKGLGIFAAGAAGGYGLRAYRDSARP